MSKYYSDLETDKRLKNLELRIAQEYQKAYREMHATASQYFITLKDRYDKEYEAYQGGAYTDEQFKAWYRTQVSRGKGYDKMVDKLAGRMVEADKIAQAYITDTTPSIYTLNYNYEAYLINRSTGVDFHLIDEQTVKELMEGGNHTEFLVSDGKGHYVPRSKTTRIDPDKDYKWNSKKIHSALNSAIIQGKSVDNLADSFYAVMKSGRASAIRNARTSITSAQNAGRMASYQQAEEMGIQMEKEWIATLDARTRDSHQQLDGERVPYDETFSNGLMYPADPKGEPAEVYNCRCTMRAIVAKVNESRDVDRAYKDKDGHREYEDDDTPKSTRDTTYSGRDNTLSYKKWKLV